jgi:hypothetical protein
LDISPSALTLAFCLFDFDDLAAYALGTQTQANSLRQTNSLNLFETLSRRSQNGIDPAIPPFQHF